MKKEYDFVKDILRIVSIESFTGDESGISKCQNEFKKIAESMGFDVNFHAQGKVLVIEPKGMQGIPEIGMVVHLDTVPFDDEGWVANPLGEIKDGRIYGRGVVDDKAAAVLALYAVFELSNEITNSWQIIVGSDEEGKWLDMDLFMKENPKLAKFLFTIDGDGIQHGCRGYMDVCLEFRRNLISNELSKLTQLYVPNAVNNVVPSDAVAEVEGKIYRQKGIAVHSSVPEEGKNALTDLVIRISDNKSVVEEFPKFFLLMDRIKNSDVETSIGFQNQNVSVERGYNTTVVPVSCEVKGDLLRLEINVRLGVKTSISMISDMLSYIALQYDCNCYVDDMKLPGYVEPSSKYVQCMLEAYKEVLGKETVSNVALGTGYNAALPNCIIFGPRFDPKDDEEDLCHCINESRKVSDLIAFYRMLKRYLKKVLIK